MGLHTLAMTIRVHARRPELALHNERHYARTARELRTGVWGVPMGEVGLVPTWAFLLDRAADAVAKLRATESA